MAAVSNHRPSSLNPNALIFVPWAYRAVEDFSDEWWELVQSSAWFRDYWLQDCFQEPHDVYDNDDEIDLPEIEAAFDGYTRKINFPPALFRSGSGGRLRFGCFSEPLFVVATANEEGEGEIGSKDLVSLVALKWGKNRVMPQSFEG
ncbi:hypothetical protein ACLOJK_010644 [Asimina triloba]